MMSAKPPSKKNRTVKNVNVEVQRTNVAVLGRIPAAARIQQWAIAALGRRANGQDLTVRVVGKVEMARLNRRYRGKIGPTNVLSFQADVPPGVETSLLGDIVICADVVWREAQQQGKHLQAHWCHMVVHGVLHLLGYDHENDRDAKSMERHETTILLGLGFAKPY